MSMMSRTDIQRSISTHNHTTHFEILVTYPLLVPLELRIKFMISLSWNRQEFCWTYYTYDVMSTMGASMGINGNGNWFGGKLCRVLAGQIISTLAMAWRSFHLQEQPPLLNCDYVMELIKPHLRVHVRQQHKLKWKRLGKGLLRKVQLRLRIQRLAKDGDHIIPSVIWEQICQHLDRTEISQLEVALA